MTSPITSTTPIFTTPFTDTATLAPALAGYLATFDPALTDLLADDVVLRASGAAEWAGTHHGKDAVIGYLMEVGGAFPDQEIEVLDCLVSPQRIALYLRLTVRRDGASVTDLSLWTFTVDASGHVVDWELNDFDQYAMDAFWARFPRSAA